MFRLNLLLGVFNLLPVPPLDGSAGIMIFMSESTAQRYLDWLRESSYARLGLLVGLLAFRYLYGPIEAIATNLLLRGHFCFFNIARPAARGSVSHSGRGLFRTQTLAVERSRPNSSIFRYLRKIKHWPSACTILHLEAFIG